MIWFLRRLLEKLLVARAGGATSTAPSETKERAAHDLQTYTKSDRTSKTSFGYCYCYCYYDDGDGDASTASQRPGSLPLPSPTLHANLAQAKPALWRIPGSVDPKADKPVQRVLGDFRAFGKVHGFLHVGYQVGCPQL